MIVIVIVIVVVVVVVVDDFDGDGDVVVDATLDATAWLSGAGRWSEADSATAATSLAAKPSARCCST